MGGCISKPDEFGRGEELARSRAIDKAIKEDEKRLEKEVKLLLLGAGASGKSTILKQMRILNNMPFSKEEVEDYRKIVFLNLVEGMRGIIDVMDVNGMTVSAENRGYIAFVDEDVNISTGQPFPFQYQNALLRLWQDEGVKECWTRSYEWALPENMPYFYDDLPRLFDPEYTPTDEDILRVRSKTTGISETRFDIRDRAFRIFDAGGQRAERRKWAACFEGVTSVLFLASLSDYNAAIVEDRDANGMEESLIIWGGIVNSQWFVKSSMILFLNKADLLLEKLKDPNQQIKTFFPDFPGKPGSFKDAVNYFKETFRGINQTPDKEIYVHVTTATDTDQLRVVMLAVTDTIVRNSLRDMRIL